jgi:hypothetical protein
MERYAARLDDNENVVQVIVIPPEEADAAAYCASIGLPGIWRDCADLPRLGTRHHEGRYLPHWQQIFGADTEADGGARGFPEGFEVWHKGKAWASTTAGNVSEPGADGWREVDTAVKAMDSTAVKEDNE